MRRFAALAPTLAALALAACGDDDGDATPESGSQAGASTAKSGAGGANGNQDGQRAPDERKESRSGIEIVAGDSRYGSILFDADRQAIYLFDKETTSESQCYGECAAAWPPVLTDGEPQAGDGLDAKLLGTTERDDGSTQATYKGHPLYYYVDDPPGEILCQNVVEYGGTWLVVDPSGDAVS